MNPTPVICNSPAVTPPGRNEFDYQNQNHDIKYPNTD